MKHKRHKEFIKLGFRFHLAAGCDCNDFYKKDSIVIEKDKCKNGKRAFRCRWVGFINGYKTSVDEAISSIEEDHV